MKRPHYFVRGPDARKQPPRSAPDDEALLANLRAKHPYPLAPDDQAKLTHRHLHRSTKELDDLQVKQAARSRQKRLRSGRGADSEFLRKFRGPRRPL